MPRAEASKEPYKAPHPAFQGSRPKERIDISIEKLAQAGSAPDAFEIPIYSKQEHARLWPRENRPYQCLP